MTNDDAAPAWVPHGARYSDDQAAERGALVEGFPAWFEPSVREWLASASYGVDVVKAQRVLRVSMQSFDTYWESAQTADRVQMLDYLLHHHQRQRRQRFNVFDGAVSDAEGAWGADEEVRIRKHLEVVLAEAGSAWRVVDTPHWGLERRVNDTSRALVEVAAQDGSDAGRSILAAWNACYRPDPDYSKAYGEAVTAVEAWLLPTATPNDPEGTFGKAVSHVRDTSQRWSVGSLQGKHHSGDTLVAMLQTLWHGQERHARPDGSIVGVSREEAEAAVSLAVTLVHWFSAGLVMKKPKK